MIIQLTETDALARRVNQLENEVAAAKEKMESAKSMFEEAHRKLSRVTQMLAEELQRSTIE